MRITKIRMFSIYFYFKTNDSLKFVLQSITWYMEIVKLQAYYQHTCSLLIPFFILWYDTVWVQSRCRVLLKFALLFAKIQSLNISIYSVFFYHWNEFYERSILFNKIRLCISMNINFVFSLLRNQEHACQVLNPEYRSGMLYIFFFRLCKNPLHISTTTQMQFY